MKNKLLIFILSFNLLSFSQVVEGSITYKIELLDEFSGMPRNNTFGLIDWQFKATFSPSKALVYQQYMAGKHITYIYDKNSGDVLNLYCEFTDKFVSSSQARGKTISDIGHSYGDTTVTAFDETKEILGYTCRKVVHDLGGQVKVTYWITEEIDVGAIVNESPLALEHPALEFTFEGGGMTQHFLASNVETKVEDHTVFEKPIPNGYSVTAPLFINVQGLSTEDPIIDSINNNLVQFPEYPEGHDALTALFKGLPPYKSMEIDYIEREEGELYYFEEYSFYIFISKVRAKSW